jgi:hypothetical protein
MKNIMPVQQWLDSSQGISQLENEPIMAQLSRFDQAGTGVGLIMFLEPMFDENDQAQQLNVASMPVFKIQNQWVVITDDDLSDLVSIVIRMITAQ